MISAGRLRHLAVRLAPSASRDALGQRVDAWTQAAQFRADLRSDSADERQYADGTAVVRSYEVRARWNTVRSIGLSETDRILVRGRTLRIRAIQNLDERDRVAVIDCEEVT
jgi:SPP1 family predicted phage head-tail adaptor